MSSEEEPRILGRNSRPAPAQGPRWWYGAIVAVALLVLPITAWFAFPSGSRTVGPTSAAPSSGVAEESSPADEEASEPTSGSRRVVSGTVVDEDGNPVAGARIKLLAGSVTGGATANQLGVFTLKAPRTAVTLTVSHAGYGSVSEALEAGGDVTELELRLSKRGAVVGTLQDGNGDKVANGYVVCDKNPDLHAVTGDDGVFTLPAEADGCSATASHPDHGSSPAVTLQAGKKNVLELPSPGKIAGSVLDDKGKPITSFTISIESFVPLDGDRDAPFFKQERVESDIGQFELDDLAPGRYVLAASAAGRPPAKSRPIDVASGQRVRGVEITAGRGAILVGRITDRATHQPIEGVSIRLDAAAIGGFGGSVQSDADGHYTLEGVPSGAFSARFSHRDYKDRIVSLDASSSKKLEQDVDLGKKGDGSDTEMTGIGATLLQGPSFVEVASVLEGGPAAAAGVQAGDRIERIEGSSAASYTVNDCVQRLRGQEGTRVSVTIGRGTKTLEIRITRAVIVR